MNEADKVQIGGQHYKEMGVQPWEAMQAWMTHEEFIGYLRGNAIKYLSRAGNKDGNPYQQDIAKAYHYISKLLDVV